MRKSFKFYFVFWLVLFLIFNIFLFVIPTEIEGKTIIQIALLISRTTGIDEFAKALAITGIDPFATYTKFGGAFWIGYIFINLTFIGQLITSHYAFAEKNNDKAFLNIALVRKSYIGMIVMVVVGLVAMFYPDCPVWVGGLICALVLIFSIISVLKGFARNAIVNEKEAKISKSISNINELIALAEKQYKAETDYDKKAELKKIYEAIRYTDPVSNEKTLELEEEIRANITDLEKVVELIKKREAIIKTNKR